MTDPQEMSPDTQTLTVAAQALARSARLVVLTGAGISKESGIPTFRDAQQGLWAQFDPLELATPRGFRHNPKRVWDWYQYRRALLAEARPNPGHYAIAALEERLPHVAVITQNVDGLHQLAGSRDVLPVHGDIRRNKCFANCQGDPTDIDIAQLTWDPEAGPPRCPHCGAYVRPAVVWYEEPLPLDLLERARHLCSVADVLLVVGTSGVTQPVASLPLLARQHGALLIEVNPQTTPITPLARMHLAGPAGVILPQLVALIPSLQEPPHA